MKFDPQNIGKESVKNASRKSSLYIIHESEKMILETKSVEKWNHHMKHIVMFIASTNSLLLLLCFSFSILFKLHSLCVCLFIATWSDFSWELDEERVTSYNLLCLVMQVSPLEKSMDVYFCSYWKFLDDFLLFESLSLRKQKKCLVLIAKREKRQKEVWNIFQNPGKSPSP